MTVVTRSERRYSGQANRTIARIIAEGVGPSSDAFFADALRRAGVDVSRVPLANATVNEATIAFERASDGPAQTSFLRLESRP